MSFDIKAILKTKNYEGPIPQNIQTIFSDPQ